MDLVAALVPSIGVGLLFWFVIRAILSADRRERAAMAAFEKADANSSDVRETPKRDEFDGG